MFGVCVCGRRSHKGFCCHKIVVEPLRSSEADGVCHGHRMCFLRRRIVAGDIVLFNGSIGPGGHRLGPPGLVSMTSRTGWGLGGWAVSTLGLEVCVSPLGGL